MASQGNRHPRPPLEQSFEKVGTFEKTESGAIIPVITTEQAQPPVDPTDFQGGRS